MNEDTKQTIQTYRQIAKQWSRAHNIDVFWEKELAKFEHYFNGGSLLEIGCGDGRDAHFLGKMSQSYLGTDIVPEFTALAARSNPDLTFKAASINQLSEKVDGIWSAATLMHIPKESIVADLRHIATLMHDTTILFISVKQGEGEALVPFKGNTESNRYFAYYSTEEFSTKIAAAGLEIIETGTRPYPKEDTNWLTFFITKAKG